MNIVPAITPDTVSVPAQPARRLVLRFILIMLATMETFDGLSHISKLFALPGLSDVPTLFADASIMPGPGFGGFLIKAHIATHPLLALAALVLAATGKVRGAIVALGVVIVIRWLSYMPQIIDRGLVLTGPGPILTVLAFVLSPPPAASAIACAAHNERLGLATLLLSIPVLFNLFIVILTAGARASGC